jgi:hypothetical protein
VVAHRRRGPVRVALPQRGHDLLVVLPVFAPAAAPRAPARPGRALAEAGAAVLIVEQRARAVLAISDYTYVLGGGQVLMADTPARLNASQEFTESFFGVGPTTPKTS